MSKIIEVCTKEDWEERYLNDFQNEQEVKYYKSQRRMGLELIALGLCCILLAELFKVPELYIVTCFSGLFGGLLLFTKEKILVNEYFFRCEELRKYNGKVRCGRSKRAS